MVYICNNYMCKLESNESENRSIHENLTEDDDDNNVSDILNDTCLQPTDIGQKVLDHYFYDIYEANEGNEAKSFPPLLSQIRKHLDRKRGVNITCQSTLTIDSRMVANGLHKTLIAYFSKYA